MAKVTKKTTAAKKQTAVTLVTVEAVRKDELAHFRQTIPSVVRQANAMTVESAEAETVAYEAVGVAKKMLREAEVRRKAITQPLDNAKKETMRLFKDLTAPLEEAVGVMTGKITAYRDEQERIAAEAERKRLADLAELEAKRIEAEEKAESRKTAKGQANALAIADAIDDQMTELEQVEYVPDVGSATVASVWTYQIVDDEAVPREFCSPDRGKLRQAVRDGIRQIAGVRVYQERSVRSRY